ncbi:DUF2497 domain-containing protein [Hyphomonas pacifica]|uniref:Pole-organizing protein PopZ n=1 Tax=Hyphomonas pacifica TaxID=1280941 RepID=A0A062U198_9PROT|nr:DUF2497 domain-containing protein [Hyphomonas pacifica]KCZ50409.1 hypothetical protein HY2_14035 [Hyphomonas pacifica]RAN32708.1 hypothetical protein HY3_14520 [Hyphomonas pacifica]
MANEAHKEPTMEEILASIRKIISDDDVTPAPAVAQTQDESTEDVTEEDAFESLDLAEADQELDDVMFGEEEAFEADIESFESFDSEEDETSEASPSFEDMLGTARAISEEAKAQAKSEPEPDAEVLNLLKEVTSIPEETAFEPEIETALEPENAAPADMPEPVSLEKDMAATARYQQTVLTDDQTADAAAGALGKLISKMDIGSDNTLEGLVRELLKPMIKEWLDANLPSIVEEKVEAEVQRIARMAR